ncbi:hypothetical protein [Paraburkholderia sp. J10-1]|uniref:hypothetical protein n=1 Tax=Paraburkholderia sp. J10-1 TaxID=2805430 RepID=UPI002AB6D0DF|nr:hypothetical protein [Paraburkholderia sp. J10-1]
MDSIRTDSAENSNKKKAQLKIDAKLDLLGVWSKSGIPWITDTEGRRLCDSDNHPVLEYFPSTIEEFAAWTSVQHTAPTLLAYPQLRELKSFSRDTLNQPHNTPRKDLVDAALKGIQAKAALQAEEINFAAKLAKVTAERDHWKKLAHAQETEIAVYRELATSATESLEEEQALRKRVSAHAQRKITRLQNELAKIRTKHAQGKVVHLFPDSKKQRSEE